MGFAFQMLALDMVGEYLPYLQLFKAMGPVTFKPYMYLQLNEQ